MDKFELIKQENEKLAGDKAETKKWTISNELMSVIVFSKNLDLKSYIYVYILNTLKPCYQISHLN